MWPLGCDPGMGEEENSGSSQEKKKIIQKTSACDWKKVQQQAVIGTVFPNKLWGCSPISDSRSGSPLTETNGYLPATSKEVFKMRLLNS